MSGPGSPRVLLGRRDECAALSALVAAARSGRSQVLVVRGEPGIGKTALLQFLVDQAAGCETARIAGVESEMELAFAGIQQLCGPYLEQVEGLPTPQRNALRTALGLESGPPPDRFLVGLAVLTLLGDVSDDRPLVCVVDDAQWLDDASVLTLTFVARRLLAEPIALVFAARPDSLERELDGLPQLLVGGLTDGDARTLVHRTLPVPLDAAVLDQVVAECKGNPLALLELPGGWRAADQGGRASLPDEMSVRARIEVGFVRRLRGLPRQTQLLVLAAAAEPTGDVETLWKAMATLDIEASALLPAQEAAVLDIDTRVRFRHPLIRSTAYGLASADDLHTVHHALATAIDKEAHPDRRAWHRAQAADGPDDDVAAELEASADRAQARGGVAAAAAFLQKATELTVDPGRRAHRALAAARATLQSGSPEAAAALLDAFEHAPLDDGDRASMSLLRGQLAFVSSRGAEAPALLVAAARQFAAIDPSLTRDTCLDALAAALFVGRFAGGNPVRDVAAAGRAVARGGDSPTDLLLDALVETIVHGYRTGAPALHRAVAAFRTESMPPPDALRWLWLATHAAHDVWDEQSWKVLSDTHIRLARQAGALQVLPLALSARAGLHLFAGEFGPAESLVEEIAAVSAATGNTIPPYGALALAAYRGRDAEAADHIISAIQDAESRGEGMGVTLLQHALAVLYNGLGQFDTAFAVARNAAEHPAELAFSTWSLVQLVEAAELSGRHADAVEAVERLIDVTTACATDWALGTQARSRALVASREEAGPLYRRALDHFAQTGLPLELARTRLLYGEWLHRTEQRQDAREQLRTAHEAFAAMGAEAFASRARKKLLAVGERVRVRTVGNDLDLTAQEAQITRLAATGHSNPEIAAELFLSPRTVEWHLSKVFAKLGVTSRRQLAGALEAAEMQRLGSNV